MLNINQVILDCNVTGVSTCFMGDVNGCAEGRAVPSAGYGIHSDCVVSAWTQTLYGGSGLGAWNSELYWRVMTT